MTNQDYNKADESSKVDPLPPWMSDEFKSSEYEIQDAVGSKRAYVMCSAGHRSVPFPMLFGEMDTRFSSDFKEGSDFPRCGVKNCPAESWIGWIDINLDLVAETAGDN